MAVPLEELPLFPLNTVLFPRAQVLLHVFEDRYRAMVRHCLQAEVGFGVVLIRSGQEVGGSAEPYLVGTEAKLVSVQTYDDGRMDVRVDGSRRFRIRKIDESRPFMMGYVEPVEDEALSGDPRTDAIVYKAREYMESFVETYCRRNGISVANVRLPQDPTALSFVIANMLQVDNVGKQHLLELTDTTERLADMIPMLEQHIVEAASPEYYKLTRENLAEWIFPN